MGEHLQSGGVQAGPRPNPEALIDPGRAPDRRLCADQPQARSLDSRMRIESEGRPCETPEPAAARRDHHAVPSPRAPQIPARARPASHAAAPPSDDATMPSLDALPSDLAAAIARRLDPRDKAALRRACKALRRAANATVTAASVRPGMALPPPALFPHLTAIHFITSPFQRPADWFRDEQLRGLVPALASLPNLASLCTPTLCYTTTATLEALVAACPRLRELDLGDAGGSPAAACLPCAGHMLDAANH
jgi:hypothetical protein